MPFYRDYIYPRIVDVLGDPPPIRKIREQIIPLTEGNVLEVGAGSCANFPHYDPKKVSKIYALEPNPGMIQIAQKQHHRTRLTIEYIICEEKVFRWMKGAWTRLLAPLPYVRSLASWMLFEASSVS